MLARHLLRLVVVGDDGMPIGVVTPLDLLRSVSTRPPPRPAEDDGLPSRSYVGSDVVQASRFAVQVVPEVGMGDADEQRGSFADAPAEELGDAVFGDHGPDMGAAGDDAGSLGQNRRDTATKSPASNMICALLSTEETNTSAIAVGTS